MPSEQAAAGREVAPATDRDSRPRRLADAWEDVLQELRIEVFRLLEKQQFRGDSSLKTYLWRVVSRSCAAPSPFPVSILESEKRGSFSPTRRENLPAAVATTIRRGR